MKYSPYFVRFFAKNFFFSLNSTDEDGNGAAEGRRNGNNCIDASG